ncbi:MAG: hypothetical protein AB7U48_02095 [Bauldia sp.]
MSTLLHGVGDYIGSLVLIASPWLFGFAEGGVAQWLPVALGALVLVYSLFTNFELGVFRVLPVSAHLAFDGAGGLLLAGSPWVFGFADTVFVPHLVFGLLEIGASLTPLEIGASLTTRTRTGGPLLGRA